MSKKINVKECPFNHIDETIAQKVFVKDVGRMFTVFCSVCGSSGPASETPEGAISEWNNRGVILLSEEVYNKALLLQGDNNGKENT